MKDLLLSNAVNEEAADLKRTEVLERSKSRGHSELEVLIANLEEDIEHYILKINELESFILNRDLELENLRRVVQ
jgi:hypothetical protein